MAKTCGSWHRHGTRRLTANGFSWFCAFACLVLIGCDSSIAPEKSGGPNILVILADDFRADAISSAGHPFVLTPNIDQIASEGVTFQNAFVVHSLCSPSRATLLTGMYTHQHGVTSNEESVPRAIQRAGTISGKLQDVGYRTAFIGKWHMGSDDGPQPGFDHWVSFEGQGRYTDPDLNVNGTRLRASGHMTDILTDYAVRFVAQSKNVPFFLVLSHKAVHDPFRAQPRFRGAYDHLEVTLPGTFLESRKGRPGFLRTWWTIDSPDSMRTVIRRYLEAVTGVDDGVGRVMQALRDLELLDKTLVVFTSDNGFLLGEHGLLGKRLPYDESIRVPLILRYPAWAQGGSLVDGFALNIDLAPTILDVAALDKPRWMTGFSLRLQIQGLLRRRSFLYQYHFDPVVPAAPTIRGLRTERYLLARYRSFLKTEEEFFDLWVDPNQTKNRVADSDYRQVVEYLRSELDRRRRALGDS